MNEKEIYMKNNVILSILSVLVLTGSVVLADVINLPGAPVMPEKPKPEYNGIYKHIDSPTPNFAQTPGVNSYNSGNVSNTMSDTMSGVNPSVKNQLDSIAKSILLDAERQKGGGMVDQNKMKKMMDLGVTAICPPQIIAKPPGCPNPNPHEIKVNGKTLKGRLCALTCYEYKGKQYDVGYCK